MAGISGSPYIPDACPDVISLLSGAAWTLALLECRTTDKMFVVVVQGHIHREEVMSTAFKHSVLGSLRWQAPAPMQSVEFDTRTPVHVSDPTRTQSCHS